MTKTAAPTTPTTSSDVADARAELDRASGSLRDALKRLHAAQDEAWARYRHETDDAISRMDAELSVSEAKLKAERAQTRDELRDALEEAVQAWRGRADELRVQAHLGELGVRDVATHALDRLDRAGFGLSGLLDRLPGEAAEVGGVVRDNARRVLDDVRDAIGGLVIAARDVEDDHDDD